MQNQAAAQKLLQKLNHPNQDDRHSEGRKHKGKGKQEDPVVFTLEEYESRKAQGKPLEKDEVLDISHDEHLAWQLQNQFNLEDSWVSSLISLFFPFIFLHLLYLFQSICDFFRYKGIFMKLRHKILE